MKRLALFVAGWFAIISPAFAETFIWDCNKEADMKEYRGERSDNGGAYVLNGTASPEPDTSGNGYDATLTGTGEGSAPDACPNLRGLMLLGVGR